MNAEELAALNNNVQPSSIVTERKLIRALFYGEVGMGKTTLAAQLVEKKGLLVTTDSAWIVIHKYPELAEKIDRIPFDGLSQIRSIAQAHNEGHEPWADYDTLIWDTASTGVDLMLRRLVDAYEFKKQQMHRDLEAYPHYRMIERALIQTVNVLKDSKLNVIYLAHERAPTQEDRDNLETWIRASFPKASYRVLAREVSLIGWQHKNAAGDRLVQFNSTNKVQAKSQLPTVEEKTYPVAEISELITKWKEQ